MFKLNLRGLTRWEEYIANHLIDDFIDLMGKDLSEIELTIQNIPSNTYPLTAPKRLNPKQREDYIIYLCHQPDYWCQMMYQLAHELGHFFMDCYPQRENLRWIDECLCELFSLIFLARSVKFFERIASQYVTPAKDYLKEILQTAQSYSAIPCRDFVAQNQTALESDPTEEGIQGRPRNCYIAAKLFEDLGYDGKGLSAVCLFSELAEAQSSKQFFDLWLQHCRTDDEKLFVTALNEELGI